MSVNVIFRVIPKYIIEEINLFRKSESIQTVSACWMKGELQAGVMLDEYKVSEAAAKIEAYYLKKGYTDIVVNYRIQRNEGNVVKPWFCLISTRATTFVSKDCPSRGIRSSKTRNWPKYLKRKGKNGIPGSLAPVVLTKQNLRTGSGVAAYLLSESGLSGREPWMKMRCCSISERPTQSLHYGLC